MLTSMRKSAGGWLAKILLFLLVVSFAVWGINDVFTGYRGDAVIAVGDTEISGEELQLEIQAEVQALSRQIGRPLTMQETRALGIDQQVLGRLVTQAVLDEAARQYGVGVTEDAIREAIVSDPRFNIGTVFDRGSFEQYLFATRQTEAQFVAQQHDFLSRQIVGEALGGGGSVPATIVDALAEQATARRSATFFSIGADSVAPVATPDDATLAAWFDRQQGVFRAPEYREVGLIVLTVDVLADEIELTEDDMRAHYDAFIDRYSEPERRQVRQIVFSTPDDAAQARERLVAGNATFEDIAGEQGLSVIDTDLGLVTRGDLVDPAIAAAAFSLDVEQVSTPVDGRFGPALVTVTEIEEGHSASFEEARDEIRRELALFRAEELLLDIHDAIEDSRAAGSTLREAAQEQQLPYQVIAAMDATGLTPSAAPAADFDGYDRVVTDVFDSDVGLENNPVQLPDTQFAWFEVLNVTPDRDRTLDEVREEAVARYVADELAARLDARAAELANEIRAGNPIIAVASAVGAPISNSGPVTRNDESDILSPAAIAAMFSDAQGSAGWAQSSAPERRIIYVTHEMAPDPQALAEAREMEDAGLEFALANDMLTAYVTGLQEEFEIVINEPLLEEILTYGAPRSGGHAGM